MIFRTNLISTGFVFVHRKKTGAHLLDPFWWTRPETTDCNHQSNTHHRFLHVWLKIFLRKYRPIKKPYLATFVGNESGPVGHLAFPFLGFWAAWTGLSSFDVVETHEVCALGDVCSRQKHGRFQPTRKSGPVRCSWISELPDHTGVSWDKMMVWFMR